jgi:ribonuclease HI
MKKEKLELPVYSDSRNAILWVKQKKTNTKLVRTRKNEKVFELIERAETWLKNNQYNNPVLKWETSVWGEIPADFGRK